MHAPDETEPADPLADTEPAPAEVCAWPAALATTRQLDIDIARIWADASPAWALQVEQLPVTTTTIVSWPVWRRTRGAT